MYLCFKKLENAGKQYYLFSLPLLIELLIFLHFEIEFFFLDGVGWRWESLEEDMKRN